MRYALRDWAHYGSGLHAPGPTPDRRRRHGAHAAAAPSAPGRATMPVVARERAGSPGNSCRTARSATSQSPSCAWRGMKPRRPRWRGRSTLLPSGRVAARASGDRWRWKPSRRPVINEARRRAVDVVSAQPLTIGGTVEAGTNRGHIHRDLSRSASTSFPRVREGKAAPRYAAANLAHRFRSAAARETLSGCELSMRELITVLRAAARASSPPSTTSPTDRAALHHACAPAAAVFANRAWRNRPNTTARQRMNRRPSRALQMNGPIASGGMHQGATSKSGDCGASLVHFPVIQHLHMCRRSATETTAVSDRCQESVAPTKLSPVLRSSRWGQARRPAHMQSSQSHVGLRKSA